MTISVVIPTYNYAQYLAAAVASALAQTLPPLEVLVIDDGSTDNTRRVMEAFSGSRLLRYIYQENRGLSGARNTGIHAAKGDWIALLDSDDLWHPAKLERITKAIATHTHLAAIGTASINFATSPPYPDAVPTSTPECHAVTLRDLVYGVHFSGGSGAVIRRTCFNQVGDFDESLQAVEDLELWWRLAARYHLARLEEPLTFVRVHPASMSVQADRMLINHQKAIEKAFATIPELRRRRFWNRVALARMYRGVAVMHREAGNTSAALLSLIRSALACPIASGTELPFCRLVMASRIILKALRKANSF